MYGPVLLHVHMTVFSESVIYKINYTELTACLVTVTVQLIQDYNR